MNNKQKSESIIKYAIANGYLTKLSQSQLRDTIASALFLVDERSIIKWEKALFRFGYIEVDNPQFARVIYKWNFQKLSEIPTIKQLTIEQTEGNQ